MYSITQKGREQLAKWLAVEPQPEIPRNELLLKLFFSAQVSPRIPIGHLERMVEEESTLLKEFRQAEREIAGNRQYPDAPYWRMTARFGQLELEAHLRWAQETLGELRRMEASRRRRAIGKVKLNAVQ